MAKLDEWSPYTRFVQGGMVDGEFVSAAFTIVAAGPPRLSNIGGPGMAAVQGKGQAAMPIGVVQNISVQQSRNFNRFWELGSERSYFIAGRTQGQIGLSRVMYHGPSLLRMLYAYYQDLIPPTVIVSVFANPGAVTVANPHQVKIPPGYENIYLNLASDLFMQPMGLLMYMRDTNENTLGCKYFEACYVPSHQLATDAGGVVIQENVSIQYERMVPVAVASLALVTGEFDPNSGV